MAPRETSEIAQRLAHVPLFEGLSADTLVRTVALAHARPLKAGELFFGEGDQAEAFFVLMSGRLKLTQLTPGHQVVLRLIGPGDVFGGVGAFGEPTYPVSAEAVEPSVALSWMSTTMRQLLETEPRIAVNALRFTTLYTVSRLLSAWEAQGIVQGGRQHIVLTKPHALVAIAEDLPAH